MSFNTDSDVDSVPKPMCFTPLAPSKRISSSVMRQMKSVEAWNVQLNFTPESTIPRAIAMARRRSTGKFESTKHNVSLLSD